MDSREQRLQAEIDHAATTLTANEDMGDRRVNTLLTIAGAAGVVFGFVVDADSVEGTTTLLAAAAAFGAVALVGLITLTRIMHRNIVTTELINALNRTRVPLIQADQDLVELLPYLPGKQELTRSVDSIFSLDRGGHLQTVGLINALTVSAAVGAGAAALSGSALLWLVSIPVLPAVWAWQMVTARKVYESEQCRRKKKRAEAIDHWAATAPNYRAGVGLIVSRSDGSLLSYTRIDAPDGARQLPQGGIERGESVNDAGWRELEEETGLTPEHVEQIKVSEFLTVYELPENYQSSKTGFGQVHRWIHYRLLDGYAGNFEGTYTELGQPEWIRPEDLPEATVEFRRPVYQEVVHWLQQLEGG